MKFKTLHGGEKRVSKIRNYLIDWDEKSKSKVQFKTKQTLYSHWKNNVVFEEFPVVGTRLSIDFYNATKKIAIEVQGAQHRKYVPFFHNKNKSNYIDQLRRDKLKQDFCIKNEIKYIEIYDGDDINKDLLLKLGVI
jgi:hypothetical protein